MAATQAQKTRNGRKNYGLNYKRGRSGERRAARELEKQGYSCALSPGSAGWDIIASKNGKTRRIQVKTIKSRAITSKKAAKNRIKGKPFNVNLGSGGEVWLYDRDDRLWVIRG